MTQSETVATPRQHKADVINELLGIEGTALSEVRRLRDAATDHTQGSYDALFGPNPGTPVSRVERRAAALRVAILHGEQIQIAHYAALLRNSAGASAELEAAVGEGPGSGALSERLDAILRHVDLLVIRPAAATQADLKALSSAGLADPEIVTVSQLIAFTSFQARVLVGLSLLRGDDRTPPASVIGPKDAPNTGFTQEQIGWNPWIEPFAAAEATEEQRAVLPGQRLDSPYFRLLALDPTVLGERTATDNGIFYTHEGLPRAERELSAAVTSRVNGCIFCASVHSRFASQLSDRTQDVQRVLDEGVDAQLDERWRAVADLAAALTATPPVATQQHIARLRELGLADLDLLDAVQATAFFGWANRLMLTLGEPVPPTSG